MTDRAERQVGERLSEQEEREERWFEALERMYAFVPLAQYDDVTKLAESAVSEMIARARQLAEAERLQGKWSGDVTAAHAASSEWPSNSPDAEYHRDLAHDLVRVVGKGGKPAEVPIEFDDVREALALWLAVAAEPREHLLHPRHDRLRPLEASTMQRWWRGLLERAGVAPFPMHELRHSALDRLWRSSGNLELVRLLARHEDIRTTQSYLHATDADLRAAMRESEGKA